MRGCSKTARRQTLSSNVVLENAVPGKTWFRATRETQDLPRDRLEQAINRAVCANRMLLTTAQERIKDPRTWH